MYVCMCKLYIYILASLIKKSILSFIELPPDLCKQQTHLWDLILNSPFYPFYLLLHTSALCNYHTVWLPYCYDKFLFKFKRNVCISLCFCVWVSAHECSVQGGQEIAWNPLGWSCRWPWVDCDGCWNLARVFCKHTVCFTTEPSFPSSVVTVYCQQSMGGCACNLSTWEAGVAGTGAQGQLGLLNETPS